MAIGAIVNIGKKFLLRAALTIIWNIIKGLAKQLLSLESDVRKPVEGMVQEVVGGVWIGRGADAFVEELMELFLPDVDRGSEVIESTRACIMNAVDLVERADEESTSRILTLRDEFSQIY